MGASLCVQQPRHRLHSPPSCSFERSRGSVRHAVPWRLAPGVSHTIRPRTPTASLSPEAPEPGQHSNCQARMIVRANHLLCRHPGTLLGRHSCTSLTPESQAQNRHDGHQANHQPLLDLLLLCKNTQSPRFNESVRLLPQTNPMVETAKPMPSTHVCRNSLVKRLMVKLFPNNQTVQALLKRHKAANA